MNFLENFLLSLLAIVCIVGGIIQLVDIAIAVQNFSIVWLILFNAVFLFLYFYFIKKSKNNLKKQILIILIGMFIYAVILFSFCEFL